MRECGTAPAATVRLGSGRMPEHPRKHPSSPIDASGHFSCFHTSVHRLCTGSGITSAHLRRRVGPYSVGPASDLTCKDNRQTVNLAIEGSKSQETPTKLWLFRRVAWTRPDPGLSLTLTVRLRTVDRSEVCRLEPDEEADLDPDSAPGTRATVLQMQPNVGVTREQAHFPAEQPAPQPYPWLPSSDAHPCRSRRPGRPPAQGSRAPGRLTPASRAIPDEITNQTVGDVRCCRGR